MEGPLRKKLLMNYEFHSEKKNIYIYIYYVYIYIKNFYKCEKWTVKTQWFSSKVSDTPSFINWYAINTNTILNVNIMKI